MSDFKPTGMLLALVFASEAIDTSGESVSIKGLDISEFDLGHGLVNYEHKNEKHSNGEEVVGKVIYAKKIYNKSDCDNELQEKAWEDIQMPFLWGIIRLFDLAGHSGAQALAASVRDQAVNGEKILLRASIEGSTVTREGNKLTQCIARRLTVTFKPANRTCDSTLIADPGAPPNFEKEPIKEKDVIETIKFENPENTILNQPEPNCCIIEEDILNKAIEAGGGNVAPSSLVGGSALVKEDISLKKPFKERIRSLLSQKMEKWDRTEAKKLIKMMLPEISDEYVKHFEDAMEDLHVKRNTIKKSELPVVKLHSLEIQLRKNIEEIKVNSLTDVHLPCVYSLHYKIADKLRPVGRFMLYNNKLVHLEDPYGLLNKLLPEGPLDFNTVSQIYNLRDGQHTKIENEPIPLGIDAPKEEENEEEVQENTARPPAVWDYMRVGMDFPHTLEVKDGQYFLDGNKLGDGEVNTIYNNLRSGLATLRYRAPADKTLNKAENEIDPGSALEHVRSAVKAGHLHPNVERALTNHIYSDPLTGMGNKYAFGEFRKQNKPGGHVSLDLNDFKAINDAFGHDEGDNALKTIAGHIKGAAEEVAPGVNKTFRPGGDEFHVYLPSHQHSAMFARNLHERLGKLAPFQGVHQLTSTLGFGTSPEESDKAANIAKQTKYLPGQEHIAPRNRKMKYEVGQTPMLGHSLVPGSEGPIKIHEPAKEAIKQSTPEPVKEQAPKAA